MCTKYIIRLDDASEYLNFEKWQRFFDVFDEYKIKPIIAIIPFNKDKKLVSNKKDDLFWEKVKKWQEKGYYLAMHGYEHVYVTKEKGICGIDNKSEFAGIPLDRQVFMLKMAYNKFVENNFNIKIFVAPSHSFDKNTISALKISTKIEIISDGFYINPIVKDGIKWLPQQLWYPKRKNFGLWTLCCHPETTSESMFNEIKLFISKNHTNFVDISKINFKNISVIDVLFNFNMKIKIFLRKFLVK